MYGFSVVEGFTDVKEAVDDMIKNLANEPSLGLYFVQQHAQSSMPYLLGVKDKVVEKINETTLHTEDMEDSICAMRSISECGLSISDDMIKELNTSLLIMSTSRPKKRLIQSPRWGYPTSGNSPNSSGNVNDKSLHAEYEGKSSPSYLLSVLTSAKQKASGIRWPLRSTRPESLEGEQHMSSFASRSSHPADAKPKNYRCPAILVLDKLASLEQMVPPHSVIMMMIITQTWNSIGVKLDRKIRIMCVVWIIIILQQPSWRAMVSSNQKKRPG